TLEQIIQTATQEAVDVIGLSIMSGAHLPISKKLIAMMKDQGLDDVCLTVGGVIPYQDIPKLKEMGVSEVFPGGTSFEKITKGINSLC
ncbi:MAG: methylmalonyl-CoA mutase, partial [Desulfobacula sp.]|nr:methylmalonyl-CoA mutase [Desulfobacula sp.]